MRIWGNGAMGACVVSSTNQGPNAPWYSLRTSIKEIVIEEGVTTIANNAFYGCTELVSVSMPDTIEHIYGSDAVRASGSLTYYDAGPFYNCEKLENIILSSRLKTLGPQAFLNCTSLKNIAIPESVTALDDSVFRGCSSLETVTIPASSEISYVGERAFQSCASLTEIILPKNVSSIRGYAFNGCTNLVFADIPSGTTSIGAGHSGYWGISYSSDYYPGNTFGGCTNLKYLKIPASVTRIGGTSRGELYGGLGVTKDTILIVEEGSYADTFAQDNNLSYTYTDPRLQARVLSVCVQDEDGKEFSDGFTVTWYDENEIVMGTNPVLSGAAIEKSYSFEIELGDELAAIYEQPKRRTITPEDDAFCEVRLVPRAAISALNLTGHILDKSSQPISDVSVLIETEDGDSIEVFTDANGGFSAAVPCTILCVTVQKDNYYTKRQVLDLSDETGNAYTMADLILTGIVTLSDSLSLNITQKTAAESEDQALEIPVTSMKSLNFTLTGSESRPITDFTVQGNVLAFQPGVVSANETIKVTVEDAAGKYVGASADVLLDDDRLGSADLVLTEKGYFRLGSVSGPTASLLVFDSNGNCIQAGTAQKGMSSKTMDAGDYRLVLLQKSDLLRSVASLDYLTRVGFTAGKDYLLREFTISDGRIITIDNCAVPELNESVFSYMIAENTSITTNKPGGAAVGALILLRASYQLDTSKNVTADMLRIALPDGIACLTQYTAIVNGSPTSYIYDAAKREICISVAGRNQAIVYIYCTATDAGTHNVSAALDFSNGVVQPIGSASMQVENAKLNVVERTGISEGLNASGKTLPNSTVVLYDNDEEVGRTASNEVGSWSMEFDLVQPVYNYSYHFIRAVTETSALPNPISTEEAMITYDKESAGQVTKITMYNVGDHGAQETVFDFTDTSAATPYYLMWPSRYPTFTFKVEFAGDASKLSEVYVVTTNSAGEQTYVQTTYDAGSSAWVGTHNYRNFSDAPVMVSAEYAEQGYSGIPIDEQQIEKLKSNYKDLYQEIIENWSSALSETLQLTNLSMEGESVGATLVCTDEDTQELIFSADILTEARSLSDDVTADMLKQGGYAAIDEELEFWIKTEEADNMFQEEYVNLPAHIAYSVVAQPGALPASYSLSDNRTKDWVVKAKDAVDSVGLGLSWFSTKNEVLRQEWLNSFQKRLSEGKRVTLEEKTRWRYYYKDASSFLNKNTRLLGKTLPGISFALDAGGDIKNGLSNAYIAKGNIKIWEKMLGEYETRLKKLKEAGQLSLPEEQKIQNRIQQIHDQINAYRRDSASAISSEYTIDLLVSGTASLASLGAETAMIAAIVSSGGTALPLLIPDLWAINKDIDYAERLIKSWICENLVSGIGVLTKNRIAIDDALLELFTELDQYGDWQYGDGFMLRGGIQMNVIPIHDPSGYVYEAVPSNRLEGVTAAISCEAENSNTWKAADYDQINPQTTGMDGGYYWDVPQGNWKVDFTKSGYEPADTSKVAAAVNGWLPVPPPQLEINVGMVSTAAPTVKQAVLYNDRVEMEFSQYMDIASVQSALSLTSEETAINHLTIEPLNAEYNLENTKQYATRFSVTFKDVSLSDGVVVSVTESAMNYAGTAMESVYTSETLTASVRPECIVAQDTVSVGLYKDVEISLALQPGGIAQELVIKNLSPALIGVSETVTTNADGIAMISVNGKLPGTGLLQITEPVSGLHKTITVYVGLDSPGQSAILDAVRNGQTLEVSLKAAGAGTVYCAEYDGDGKLLSVQMHPVSGGEQSVSFTLKESGAACRKIFLLNPEFMPLCTAKTV